MLVSQPIPSSLSIDQFTPFREHIMAISSLASHFTAALAATAQPITRTTAQAQGQLAKIGTQGAAKPSLNESQTPMNAAASRSLLVDINSADTTSILPLDPSFAQLSRDHSAACQESINPNGDESSAHDTMNELEVNYRATHCQAYDAYFSNENSDTSQANIFAQNHDDPTFKAAESQCEKAQTDIEAVQSECLAETTLDLNPKLKKTYDQAASIYKKQIKQLIQSAQKELSQLATQQTNGVITNDLDLNNKIEHVVYGLLDNIGFFSQNSANSGTPSANSLTQKPLPLQQFSGSILNDPNNLNNDVQEKPVLSELDVFQLATTIYEKESQPLGEQVDELIFQNKPEPSSTQPTTTQPTAKPQADDKAQFSTQDGLLLGGGLLGGAALAALATKYVMSRGADAESDQAIDLEAQQPAQEIEMTQTHMTRAASEVLDAQ